MICEWSLPRETTDAFVLENFERLKASGILEPDERVLDFDIAMHGTDPGVLLVTTRRLLWFRSGPLSRKTRSISVDRSDTTSVEPSERRSLFGKLGVLDVDGEVDGNALHVTFDQIRGGSARAHELARAAALEMT